MRANTQQRNRRSEVLTTALAGLLLGGAAVSTVSGATYWTGGAGTDNWNTAGNWSAGLPWANSQAYLGYAAGSVLSPTVTISGNLTNVPGEIRVGQDAGSNATLNIGDATHPGVSLSPSGKILAGVSGAGTVVQQNGSVVTLSGSAQHAIGTTTVAGTYQVTGGSTLNVAANGWINAAMTLDTLGTLDIADGSMKFARGGANNISFLVKGTLRLGSATTVNTPYLGDDSTTSGAIAYNFDTRPGSKVEGWGQVSFSRPSAVNGQQGAVIANGWGGTDRILDYNPNLTAIATSASWNAVNGGILQRPAVSLGAGSSSVAGALNGVATWGHNASGTYQFGPMGGQNIQNSVAMKFSSATTGTVDLDLLSEEVSVFEGAFAQPGTPNFITAYKMTLGDGLSVSASNTMSLCIRADVGNPALGTGLEILDSTPAEVDQLKLWGFDGTTLTLLGSGSSIYNTAPQNNVNWNGRFITFSGISSVAENQYYIVTQGSELLSIPEPGTFFVLIGSGLALLSRRRRGRSA